MTNEEKLRWQKEICNIDKYHSLGYTGVGITVLCHEDTDHGRRAMEILRMVAPDVSIFYASVREKSKGGKLLQYDWDVDGKTYTFEQVMSVFKPDIISCSLRDSAKLADREAIVKPYVDNGDLIIVTSAGNEGISGGVQTRYDCGLTIGACEFYKGNKKDIRIASYSGRTKDTLDIDYVGFMGDWNGTSAATPFVAGQIALFMSRFGKVSQREFQRLIKPYCEDLGDKNKDWIYGDGLIVLPDEDVDLKGDVDMFKDVKPTRWSAEDIEWASAKGIVTGFEDGTFRPTEYLTREQVCVLLRRIYNTVKEELK